MLSSDFISAVRLLGAGRLRIISSYVMPLCLSSLIVRVTLDMAGIILTAAGLGFLGLGAQPPLPEWGAMIASGRRFILDQWWRSEEHTSELQSLMRISYAVFCLKKKIK